MAKKYLDDAGLTYFWGKVRTYFLGGTSPDDPADTTNCPKMDGTKTYGTSHILAREDHVHPTDTSRAASSHTHGDITNGGDITATAPTIASGDKLIINDESASKITNGPSFGSDTTKFLRNDGTWATPAGNTSDFTGATSGAAGTNGLVPAPAAGQNNNFLTGNGAWGSVDPYVGVPSGETHLKAGFQITRSGNVTTVVGSSAVPTATTSTDGAMSAADKAKLDSITLTNNIIDSSCLPSYVDDVIEAYPRTGQTELSQNWLSLSSGGSALTPETGKIYVLLGNSTNYSTNDTFRWSGSTYVKLADGGVSSITTSEIDTIMAS